MINAAVYIHRQLQGKYLVSKDESLLVLDISHSASRPHYKSCIPVRSSKGCLRAIPLETLSNYTISEQTKDFLNPPKPWWCFDSLSNPKQRLAKCKPDSFSGGFDYADNDLRERI